jgi:hypothetical protein
MDALANCVRSGRRDVMIECRIVLVGLLPLLDDVDRVFVNNEARAIRGCCR